MATHTYTSHTYTNYKYFLKSKSLHEPARPLLGRQLKDPISSYKDTYASLGGLFTLLELVSPYVCIYVELSVDRHQGTRRRKERKFVEKRSVRRAA